MKFSFYEIIDRQVKKEALILKKLRFMSDEELLNR